MALGVMLVVAVLAIHGIVTESFRNNASLGYNMIVGAKGGRLQLVLNTVFYLSQPVENIPYDYYLEFLSAEEVEKELFEAQVEELITQRRNRLTAAQRTELEKLSDAEQRKSLLTGRFSNYTHLAIPVLLGDYYKKYRVVGTSTRMFDDLVYDPDNDRKFEFDDGGNFQRHSEHYGYFEAVVGATVAREEKLSIGDPIIPSHAAEEDKGGELHTHDVFHVVGILKPTGTPNDRAVFVNLEGFLLMEGHAKPVAEEEAGHEEATEHGHGETHDAHEHHPEHEHADEHDAHKHDDHDAENHHGHDHDDHEGHDGHDHEGHDAHDHLHGDHACRTPLAIPEREITAILLHTDMVATRRMTNLINEDQVAQAVSPIAEIFGLLELIVKPIQQVLLTITILICVVSGVSILVSIYNSMSDRRHEIAVMRALGAGRGTVMTVVLLESVMLAMAGGLIGWAAGHLLVASASPIVEARTGVSIGLFDFPSVKLYEILPGAPIIGNCPVFFELLLIPGLILLAVIVGFLPALAAYRTDVAKSLSNTP